MRSVEGSCEVCGSEGLPDLFWISSFSLKNLATELTVTYTSQGCTPAWFTPHRHPRPHQPMSTGQTLPPQSPSPPMHLSLPTILARLPQILLYLPTFHHLLISFHKQVYHPLNLPEEHSVPIHPSYAKHLHHQLWFLPTGSWWKIKLELSSGGPLMTWKNWRDCKCVEMAVSSTSQLRT